MRRVLIAAAAASALLLAGAEPSPEASAPGDLADDASLEALLAADCVDDTAMECAQTAGRLPQEGGVASAQCPPHVIGGVIPPIRSVSDLFPTFDGAAVDTENNRVIFSDENRHSMLVYDRTAGGSSNDVTEPVQWVFGPKAQLGYIAGVEVDPKRKEFYTVNNDGGDRMVVFSYDDHGNAQPRRTLTLPHQSWDVSLAPTRDEIAITVQQSNAISIFIRGALTQIVGPVSVAIDVKNEELWVANYGDHTAVVFPRTASGNVRPKRIIRNAPKDTPTCGFTNASAAAYDSKRDEILVPN